MSIVEHVHQVEAWGAGPYPFTKRDNGALGKGNRRNPQVYLWGNGADRNGAEDIGGTQRLPAPTGNKASKKGKEGTFKK